MSSVNRISSCFVSFDRYRLAHTVYFFTCISRQNTVHRARDDIKWLMLSELDSAQKGLDRKSEQHKLQWEMSRAHRFKNLSYDVIYPSRGTRIILVGTSLKARHPEWSYIIYLWFISAIEKVAVGHLTSLFIARHQELFAKDLEENSGKLKPDEVLKYCYMWYCSQHGKPLQFTMLMNSQQLFLRYIMCYKMRSCFPRRLQWGYESNHSETPEYSAQTVSCWAAAAGCWWGSPVGDQEALCLGSEFRASALQTTTGSKDSSENWQWHTKAVAHISLVCHFHSFVFKRCQIKNGCITDQDMGSSLVKECGVVWGFLPI